MPSSLSLSRRFHYEAKHTRGSVPSRPAVIWLHSDGAGLLDAYLPAVLSVGGPGSAGRGSGGAAGAL